MRCPETKNRVLGSVEIVLAGSAVAAGIFVAFAAIWPGVFWVTALLSEFLPQVLIVLLAVMLGLVFLGRWYVFCFCGVLIVASGWASSLERAPKVDLYDPDLEFSVRIMQFNTLSSNSDAEGLISVMRAADADVISIVEPSNALIRAMRDDDAMRDTHPFRWIPDTAGAGWSVVLSKHRQRVVSGSSRWPHGTLLGRGRQMVIEDPRGEYLFVQLLPESPRTPSRWRKGNHTVLAVSEAIRSACESEGIPLVAAGDINGSPTGVRGRIMRTYGGVLYTKPRLRIGGTWPERVPAPLRIHIDDVLVGDGVSVLSWNVLQESAGSDHLPVVVELVLPRSSNGSVSAE